ncbi:MAG TPA: recombination mediator RecR [Candidatus Hydrogenedentes bacterium]|nr:MAG: Recombination protein RecR [Candidatus Hydrogenedentes bacterium ADurb.Bin179]HOH28734.1 recombination mediator RecR [Candidatus Hydrogenedentota bacterium]
MFSQLPAVERMINAFRRLPGVGRKSAERYCLHLLTLPEADALEFSEAVRKARESITWCPQCRNLTDTTPCSICSDPRRDKSTLCVVERPAGAMALEKGGSYRGLYHVLHGVLNPLDGIGPEELHIDLLLKRIVSDNFTEVIIATNATAEGEVTAAYLARRIGDLGVRVTRIAHGVPMGGGLEYADDLTLAQALDGRSVIFRER